MTDVLDAPTRPRPADQAGRRPALHHRRGPLPRRHQARLDGPHRHPAQPVRPREHPLDRHVRGEGDARRARGHRRRGHPVQPAADGLAGRRQRAASRTTSTRRGSSPPTASSGPARASPRSSPRRRSRRVDALEVIHVDWEPLPAVVDAEKATQPGAPQLHENAPNNVVFEWKRRRQGRHRRRHRRRRGRRPPADRQPAAHPQPDGDPRRHRLVQPGHRRVHDLDVEPDAAHPAAAAGRVRDGHPGAQDPLHQPGRRRRLRHEDLLLRRHGARRCSPASSLGGRPVKWVEGRRESYGSTIHGRDHITYLEIARQARTARSRACGSRRSPTSAAASRPSARASRRRSTAGSCPGRYKIPNVYCEVTGVYTNTTFVDAYRGAGRPEATYVVERAMDLLADELGHRPGRDPAAQLPAAGHLPVRQPVRAPDGRQRRQDLHRLRATTSRRWTRRSRWPATPTSPRRRPRRRRAASSSASASRPTSRSAASRRRKWIGAVGEGWGAAMWESSNIKVHLTGKVVVTMGTQPQGQGHETTYAQIISHELGVPMEDIVVQHSDTQGTPFGYGSYGSRTSSVGSTARHQGRRQDPREGPPLRGPHARGVARRHRGRRRRVPGQGLARTR